MEDKTKIEKTKANGFLKKWKIWAPFLILFLTNPDVNTFENSLDKTMYKRDFDKKYNIRKSANFIFFSIFEISEYNFNIEEKEKHLGILGNFIKF